MRNAWEEPRFWHLLFIVPSYFITMLRLSFDASVFATINIVTVKDTFGLAVEVLGIHIVMSDLCLSMSGKLNPMETGRSVLHCFLHLDHFCSRSFRFVHSVFNSWFPPP